MPLTLIKENGSGIANANSYADRADGDAYHEGHLYATAWTGASEADREKALVMATRVIDAMFSFHGTRCTAAQALQWPRVGCPDPDRAGSVSGLTGFWRSYLPESSVPAVVQAATCELARELIKADRTEAPDGEGLLQVGLSGSFTVKFDPKGRRPVIPRLVAAMLGRLGGLAEAPSGCVPLVRV